MENEKKQVLSATKSDNTKGNPYHAPAGSPEGGQFVSKEEMGGGSKTNDVPKAVAAAAPPLIPPNNNNVAAAGANPPNNNIKDYLKGFKKKTDEEIKEAQLKKENIKSIMKNPMFDKNKLSGATLEELQEVQNAVIVCEDKSQKICDELQKYNQGATVGPWQEAKFPIDYEQLKNSGKFDAKKAYFENTFKGSEEQKQAMLNVLDEFQKKGEKYIEEKQKLEATYKPYEDLIAKYQDESPYTQARKDAAVWITEGNNVAQTNKTLTIVGERTDKYMSELYDKDHAAYWAAVNYTGNGYSWLTKPLRGVSYNGGFGKGTKIKDFVPTVKALDRAIDGSTYEQDFWVRRGVDHLMIKNLGDALGIDLAKLKAEDLNTLAGTCFKDHSFVSTAGSKGAAFSGSIDMYIYCPKGTNMLHMAGHGMHKYENEFIIARGYTYKITKAYMSGGTINIDCEVVLGSNSDRHSDEKLQELANKYL